MSETWFITQTTRPQAPVQLFCLPHAGAGASAYALWPREFGADVEVHAYIPPGRERRFAEEAEVDPAAVAAAVAERTDRPFALFGHSLGARLAFEVVRELRRNGRLLPLRLFVSGCTPPDDGRTDDVYDGLSALDDEAMLERLVATGNIPEEVLDEPGLVEMLLPSFRADFTWLDTYVYHDEPPLPIPVSAFAGDADESAPPQRMAGWRRHTTSDFALHAFSGAHFFLVDRLAEVVARMGADLAAPSSVLTAEPERC